MKKLFLIFFIIPQLVFSQVVTYLDNPVDLLRQLRVVKIIDSEGNETIIEHTPARMRIYAFSFYYDEIYEEITDSNGIYDFVEDTIVVPIKNVADYYYNGDELLDSLFDYTIILDSNRTDTFLVETFAYSPKGRLSHLIKKSEAWNSSMLIEEERYYWSTTQLDSIWLYSNAYPGTFGNTYADTTHKDGKFLFVRDSTGRITQKLRYSKLIESYSYPTLNAVETLQAPHHPRSGCIVNSQISFANRELVFFYPNGLVKKHQTFYRKKYDGEEWKEETWGDWEFTYEFDK